MAPFPLERGTRRGLGLALPCILCLIFFSGLIFHQGTQDIATMTRVRAPRCNFLRTVGTRATAYPPREPLEGLRGGGSTLTVEDIKTKPFEGQKPGTSGLRKKVGSLCHPHLIVNCNTYSILEVTVFQEPGYLENFVQAIFDTNPSLKGQTLVLGGDGRYLNKYASLRIVRMVLILPEFRHKSSEECTSNSQAAANGIARVITMPDFLASTPAISHLIRQNKAKGVINHREPSKSRPKVDV
eukprot:1379749-Amorphochlora_amoeboformis.AAC.1